MGDPVTISLIVEGVVAAGEGAVALAESAEVAEACAAVTPVVQEGAVGKVCRKCIVS